MGKKLAKKPIFTIYYLLTQEIPLILGLNTSLIDLYPDLFSRLGSGHYPLGISPGQPLPPFFTWCSTLYNSINCFKSHISSKLEPETT